VPSLWTQVARDNSMYHDEGFQLEGDLVKKSFCFPWCVFFSAMLVLASGVQAQEGAGSVIWSARDQVITKLVAQLPASLPEGAVAILPPEIVNAEFVDSGASSTWATALSETLHRRRPGIKIVDRGSLTAILREQKFGDSAYADPKTAVEVGKLLAARTLILTRLHEFRLKNGRVRIRLETRLIDVQTGEDLWSTALRKGIFPWWAKLIITLVLLVLALILWRWWQKRTKKKLVREKVPRAKAEVRVDVDGLARSAIQARERLHAGGNKEAAVALQKAWTDLDAVLDRVRHALPGGSIDHSRIRDLKGALQEAGNLADLLGDLRSECDGMEQSEAGGQALVHRMVATSSNLRSAVDALRRHMV